jgi:hypothetical protein
MPGLRIAYPANCCVLRTLYSFTNIGSGYDPIGFKNSPVGIISRDTAGLFQGIELF